MLKRILNKLLSPLTLLRDALLERSLGDLSERERFERIYKSGYWRPIIGGSLLDPTMITIAKVFLVQIVK